MKILIVYATAGAGHKKAAEAIYNEAKKRNQDVRIVDFLDYTNFLFKHFFSYGYIFLIKYLPCIWKLVFHVTDSFKDGICRKIGVFFNKCNAMRYLKFLEKEKFGLVISTHFTSTEITAGIKHKLNLKLVNVVTDFGLHSFWHNRLVDKYFVASGNTKDRLLTYGVQPDNVKVSGIPVDANFSQFSNTQELSKKLGLKPDKFCVLIMTGTIGIGPIIEIVDMLKQDVQLLVVCGKNRKLFRRLNEMLHPNLKIFGLVDNVYELMSACDMIITKAGGLTISEALSKNLPMIFFSIIPGQEALNAKIIEEYGAGLILTDPDKIRQAVLELKNHRKKLEEYRQNARRLWYPNSAANVLDISLKL